MPGPAFNWSRRESAARDLPVTKPKVYCTRCGELLENEAQQSLLCWWELLEWNDERVLSADG